MFYTYFFDYWSWSIYDLSLAFYYFNISTCSYKSPIFFLYLTVYWSISSWLNIIYPLPPYIPFILGLGDWHYRSLLALKWGLFICYSSSSLTTNYYMFLSLLSNVFYNSTFYFFKYWIMCLYYLSFFSICTILPSSWILFSYISSRFLRFY